MAWRRLRAASLVALVALAPAPAAAAFGDALGAAAIHGYWTVVAREGRDGGFGFCAADVTFGADITFAVLLLPDARIQLFLDSPRLTLPGDGGFAATVLLDGALERPLRVELRGRALFGTLAPDPVFLERLGRTREILLRTPGDSFALPVGGTGLEAAVPALLDCLALRAGLGPDGEAVTR